MNTRKYKFTSNPSDGDASKLGIGEAEEESTSPTLFEHVFSLFPSYKANDSAERKNYKFTLVSPKNAYILYNSKTHLSIQGARRCSRVNFIRA